MLKKRPDETIEQNEAAGDKGQLLGRRQKDKGQETQAQPRAQVSRQGAKRLTRESAPEEPAGPSGSSAAWLDESPRPHTKEGVFIRLLMP